VLGSCCLSRSVAWCWSDNLLYLSKPDVCSVRRDRGGGSALGKTWEMASGGVWEEGEENRIRERE
jgi:hypothetical protein